VRGSGQGLRAAALCGAMVAGVSLGACAPGRPNVQGTGGATGSGNGGTTDTGGSGSGQGGTNAQGGTVGSGGSVGSGGTTGTGGVASSGGTTGSGGVIGSGGGGGRGATTGSGGGPGGTVGTGGTQATGGMMGNGPMGPCDIYAAANTPCGAAHSTVRALYSGYTGPLYQVKRSDGMTKDIPVAASGFADSAVQDSFCSGSSCTIPIIYDQSGNANHLRVTWWAYWLQNGGNPASATAAKITVGGHTVYGIKNGTNVAYHSGVQLSGTANITKGSATVTFSSAQTLPANSALVFVENRKDCPNGSFNNGCNIKTYYTVAAISAATTVTLTSSYSGTSSASTAVMDETTRGLATGDQAEEEYSVFDGKSYGQYCCFDYGNAEADGVDEGHATMEALAWGNITQFGQSGGGNGPWIGADIEDGIFEGYENGSPKVPSNTSVTGFLYVTGLLKGLAAKDCPTGLTSSGCFALKAGNAGTGKLQWKWNATTSSYGARPQGWSPQKKAGAIILATGGDGSNTGVGIWFEGAMTLGAPSDAVDDAIQANIVAAGYPH
jgi:hypothetical protein